jgi:UDP-N-acetylmuramoyl-L-alanyl-D-glutamate--2,6-diaminopimelate ligase
MSIVRRIKSLIGDRSPLRLGWHHAKAFLAALRYGFPARTLTVIGVTGTDGKTTTVGMIAHILDHEGFAVGALSTAFFRIRGDVTWNATQKTSPSPFVIQSFLRRLVKAGCTHAILEYSSHGLVQGRMQWTAPMVAAITNTSPEHLDYHKTMEQYRADKGLLFRMIRKGGTKVINREDGSFALYEKIHTTHTLVYAPKEDLTSIRATTKSSEATAMIDGRTVHLSLSIPGTFNLHNALCAILCATAVGIPSDKAASALTSFAGVPGRMERIDEGQPFAVYVDFTVTPASYTATLSTLKTILEPGHRLLALTGSCGDRMREKRPEVGRIVSQYADVMVVANEDPYTEDPENIINEVWAGIEQAKTKAHRIFDRKEAIAFLLKEAKPGDIVVLCGKGSDTTMWMKDGKVPWNEREIVRELLKEMK